MSTRDTAWTTGQTAASVLAPESGLIARADPADFTGSLLAVLTRAAARPDQLTAAGLRYLAGFAQIAPAALGRWWGAEAPVAVDPKDRRFSDPAWEDHPAFFALRQSYQLTHRFAEDLLAAGGGDARADAKAELALGLLFDALAPTNFLAGNPAALKRAAETAGASLAAGARNYLEDLLSNGGRPRQVDTSPFRVGDNLAATPGKVVFRNELMELIQYAPQTETVHEVPLLASPPWINKYYVMDLAPGRSFIEWAIAHNRTVFAISYRNPDATMREVKLDDYLIHGPRTALEIIADITGAETIDIVGLCLGGALTAMTAAYLTATGGPQIGSLTLLNTLLDYSEPGALGCFTEEKTIARLEEQMAAKGFLDGGTMATTFDLLRANDLIYSYVVSNWLMGQQPPAFDILAWNADATRMPAAMHSFYLRSCYLNNELARGEMELAGTRLSLTDIKNDTYLVGAVNDHIVPWQSSYKATGLLGGGAVRYVLSSGGHIAGIVNPPGPKAWHETAEAHPHTAEQWRTAATRHPGSWWQDWAVWAGERAGALVPPPPLGNDRSPALDDAPGRYVRG